MTPACGSRTPPSTRSPQCIYTFCTAPSQTFVVQLLRENSEQGPNPIPSTRTVSLAKRGCQPKDKDEEPSVPRGPCSWPLRAASGLSYSSGQGRSRWGLREAESSFVKAGRGGWGRGRAHLEGRPCPGLPTSAEPAVCTCGSPNHQPAQPARSHLLPSRPRFPPLRLSSRPPCHPKPASWAASLRGLPALHVPDLGAPASPCAACPLGPLLPGFRSHRFVF